MAWLDELSGRTVALDSAPLIYYIENHPHYFGYIRPFFEALENRQFKAATSVLTLTEVLVCPLRDKRYRLIEVER